MKTTLATLTVLLALALAGTAHAEHDVWGLLQVWYSYTGYDAEAIEAQAPGYESETQAGFGIRRGYLGLKYSEAAFSGSLLLNAGSSGVDLIDLWVDMKLNDVFSVRAGKFAGVGLYVAGIQSSGSLDMVERPIVAGEWMGQLGRGAGRTYGVQLTATPSEVLSAGILLHNGGQDLKRSVNDADKGTEIVDTGVVPQVDIGVTAAPSEGVRIGLTYGLPNEKLTSIGNMTAYFYYEKSRFFGKLDYAMLLHKPMMGVDNTPGGLAEEDYEYTGAGFGLTGGYALNDKFTVVGRFEQWDDDIDLSLDSVASEFPAYWVDGDEELSHDITYRRNVAVGLNYSPDSGARFDQRFQITYTRRLDERADGTDLADPNVVQAVWQVYIH